MIKQKRIMALIPARGGSKGCPGKNTRLLSAAPLVSWTIHAARSSVYVDKVVVSTDAEEIARVAADSGVEVPFLRPAALAGDNARMMDVIAHVMQCPGICDGAYDYLLLLQPTSPFRTGAHIDAAIDFLEQKKADAVVSVTEDEHASVFSNHLPADGCLKGFVPDHARHRNRQELQKYYRLNGALYISTWKNLQEHKDWFVKRSYAFVMDRLSSVDIDTQEDFWWAEFLLERKLVTLPAGNSWLGSKG